MTDLLDASTSQAFPEVRRAADVQISQDRLIVLDLETSGLNPEVDEVIAIGAVAIVNGRINYGDQIDVILRRPDVDTRNTVMIHGIGPQALNQGHDSETALRQIVHWIDGAPILGFHARFDKLFLERALRVTTGYDCSHAWLDLADAMPGLFPEKRNVSGRMEKWLDHFGISIEERHTAAADALLTAQLALVALTRCRRLEIEHLSDLQRLADQVLESRQSQRF